MKNIAKILFTMLTTCALSISCAFIFVGCSHEHEFSNSYSYNSSHHWKVCTSKKNCDQVEYYAEHFFDDWQTKIPQTCTQDELLYRACECGYEEPLPGKPANHSKINELVNTDPSGHYYACENCSEKLEFTSHAFSLWQVYLPATESSDGILFRECECGYKETINYSFGDI